MIKKEKGITLVALVIIIVVILMVAAIGIAMIANDEGTAKTAEKIAKNKTYQDYKSALEMANSEKQLSDATKQVDQDYLKDLANIIKSKKQFENCKENIKLVMYNGYTIQTDEVDLNAIYIETKEGYKFLVDMDLVIHDVDKSPEDSSKEEPNIPPDDTGDEELKDKQEEEEEDPSHLYYYYDITNNKELEEHPKVAGTYEKRCRYHEDEHESHVITESVIEASTCKKHGLKRCTCTCGNYYDYELPFTNHKYHFYTVKYSTDKRHLAGDKHPLNPNTKYYINCEYCGAFRNAHKLSGLKYNAASGEYHHYITCEYQDSASGPCNMSGIGYSR